MAEVRQTDVGQTGVGQTADVGQAEVRERKGSYGYRKGELATRLNRIEGQVRGVARMVDEEKYCVDILTQIAAIQAALERVSLGVLQDHLKGCVLEAGAPEHSEHGVEEVMDVLERFVALRR